MEKPYHIVEKDDSRGGASFLAKNGQALLPMVELIEESQVAGDELIEVLARARIEAVLRLSAEGIAGRPHPGKKGGAISWHGREKGMVCLKERKVRVERPPLDGNTRATGSAIATDRDPRADGRAPHRGDGAPYADRFLNVTSCGNGPLRDDREHVLRIDSCIRIQLLNSKGFYPAILNIKQHV